MKKLFIAIAFMAIMILPLTSLAMTSIEESDLATVTGQSGVSINMDANIHLVVDTIAWGDKDGLGAAGAGNIASGAGWIGTSGIDANIRIKLAQDLIDTAWLHMEPILVTVEPIATKFATVTPAQWGAKYLAGLPAAFDPTNMKTWGTPGALAFLAGDGTITPAEAGAFGAAYATHGAPYEAASAQITPLTIDVATDTTNGHGEIGTTFVRIGTGSLEIVVSSLNLPIALGASPIHDSNPATDDGLNQVLGSLYISGMTIRLAGGSYVDIYNGRATGQGVTIGLDVTVREFVIGKLSWGDADGSSTVAGNTYKAGYVGLEDLTIAGIHVTGKLKIDLATTNDAALYATDTTFVRLGFDNLTIGLGAVDAKVVLGDKNDFTGTKYYMGAFYMSATTIVLGGYADIYALSGKSGVSVSFDVNMPSLTINTISWGDLDGIDAITPPQGAPADLVTIANTAVDGYVGLKTLTITDSTDADAYALRVTGNVRIDVATRLAADLGVASTIPENTTFVNIGLNNVNIAIDEMNALVAMGSEKTLAVAGQFQELGSIYISGVTTDIDGFLRIYAPSATSQGVVLDLGVTLSEVKINAISWGDNDTDNIIANARAGYAGLTDLTITGLALAGKITIDVATVTANLPTSYIELEYKAYDTHNLSPTFVHIGIGSGNGADNTTTPFVVALTSLTANVGLDSAKELGNVSTLTNPTMLGSIYMSGVNASINGWVDIAAH